LALLVCDLGNGGIASPPLIQHKHPRIYHCVIPLGEVPDGPELTMSSDGPSRIPLRLIARDAVSSPRRRRTDEVLERLKKRRLNRAAAFHKPLASDVVLFRGSRCGVVGRPDASHMSLDSEHAEQKVRWRTALSDYPALGFDTETSADLRMKGRHTAHQNHPSEVVVRYRFHALCGGCFPVIRLT
jgi:hypothetical protein